MHNASLTLGTLGADPAKDALESPIRESPYGVAVVLCCFNSGQRLPETLRHLAAQRVPASLPWEVIIVDNGSTDNTKDVARSHWISHGCPAPLRVIESAPGLISARNKGLRQARYEFVLFCDDDNWLDKNYVYFSHQVMSAHPDIGVLGGRGEAACEAEPPPWFSHVQPYFAVGPQGEVSGDVTTSKGYLYGAGFVIRKTAWRLVARHSFASPLKYFGRGSNDKELCSLIRLAGYKLWYEDGLRFKHFLPASRFEWSAFLGHAYRAHKTAQLVEPFGYVLKRKRYIPPSRFHWLKVAVKISALLSRQSRALFPPRNRAGSLVRFRYACYQGNLAGWLHMRGNFRLHCEQIHDLQRVLRADRVKLIKRPPV